MVRVTTPRAFRVGCSFRPCSKHDGVSKVLYSWYDLACVEQTFHYNVSTALVDP